MSKRKITKVLIANRGEIALRIQRACLKLGIDSLSIASEADKDALFAREASELLVIGSPAPQDSYLAIDKIIKAAISGGCDAVHPGYGFLSENADFVEAVEKSGLTFIGPDSRAIRILGSKTEARRRVSKSNVPLTPGSAGGLSDQQLIKEASKIGFPVIIKAVGGGGGRGMRVVQEASEMAESLERARGESKKNFSSSDVYLEKYIVNPRHVEVQIFGDSQGNAIHFGTRDCSAQRRHQKLIEEAPAPNLTDELREKIHSAAIRAALSVAYTNAGTAEFLVSGEDFYFLEMNTRIQVEHPVTEAVTGVDLVELQLQVAMGESVPDQHSVGFDGHAIEFRIYAEDPRRNFAPVTGTIAALRRPERDWIREDYAFESGDTVTPYYDAMLSKLIVSGASRAEAIERSLEALREYEVEGLPTTIPFHKWILQRSAFQKGELDIGYIEREFIPPDKLLDDLDASEIKDPLHRSGPGGSEVIDTYCYHSASHNFEYTIEVRHQRNGHFIVTPVSAEGRRGMNRHCRASNGLETALNVLISEVLEKEAPDQIFS